MLQKAKNWTVLTLIAMLLMAQLALLGSTVGQVPAEEPYDLNLYFAADNLLTQMEPENTTQPIPVQNEYIFEIADDLNGDLTIHNPIRVFEVLLSIRAPLPSTDITIQVLDEDDIVAQKSVTLSSATKDSWDLPFENDEDNITFHSGNKIKVKIEVSRGIFMELTTNDDKPAHFTLNDGNTVTDIDVTFRNKQGQETIVFFPNVPASDKVVKIDGSVTDVFRAKNVRFVNVTIYNPISTVMLEVEELDTTKTSTYASFETEWDYSGESNLKGGMYRVSIVVSDYQGNEHSTNFYFNMTGFAIEFTSIDAEKSATIDSSVKFYLESKNVGAQTADIEITHSDTGSWNAQFDNTTFNSVPTGSMRYTTVTVSTAGRNEGDIFTMAMTATITNDDTSPKFSITLNLITRVTSANEVDLTLSSNSDAYVNLGGSAFYNFTVKNSGTVANDVILETVQTGENWVTSFTGGALLTNAINERYVHLNPSQSVQIMLTVTSPASTTLTEKPITVRGVVDGKVGVEDSFQVMAHITSGVVLELRTDATDGTDPNSDYASFTVRVSNTAGTSQMYNLTIVPDSTLRSTWDYRMRASGATSPTIDNNLDLAINADSYKDVTIEARPTNMNTLPDDYDFTITATIKDTTNYATIQVEVEVAEVMDLSMIPTDTTTALVAGDSNSFNLRVENTGNMLVTLVLDHTGTTSEDWIITADANELPFTKALTVGSVITLNITIQAGSNLEPGDYPLTLTVGVQEGSFSQDVTIDASVSSDSSTRLMESIAALSPIIILVLVMFIITGMAYSKSKRYA